MLQYILDNITGPDQDMILAAKQHIDSLAKPLGSLGRLEEIGAQIAGIQGKLHPTIEKKCTVIMASDHGIVEEGIACAPQDVTAIQTVNMTKGLTGICVISKANGADIRIVDIGVKADLNYPGIVQKKIRYGTGNFAKGPAMTREEAVKALETGIETVGQLAEEGYDLIGTGEMGIGNTSCSSAVLMALTGCDAETAVGKGGGITDEAFAKKKAVIEAALALNAPDAADPIDVLAKVGGLDLGGMAGCLLGAAYYKRPIVIDGLISAAAALLAFKINPIVKDYLIPSHFSAEPGYRRIMAELKLEPILHLNMRLGEGTGCPIAFSVIETALAVVNNMGTFNDAMIDNEYLVDIRK